MPKAYISLDYVFSVIMRLHSWWEFGIAPKPQ